MESVEQCHKTRKILPLYLPWLFAMAIQYYPVLSYFIAWAGSLFIFYLSISSVKNKQVMQPLILIQLIFAGFMCCSSIFYFLHHLDKLNYAGYFLDAAANEQTLLIAECQRYALLAHASLISGIISLRKPLIHPHWQIRKDRNALIKIGLSTFLIAKILNYIPAIAQWSIPLSNISMACSAYMLVKGLSKRSLKDFVPGAVIFGSQLLSATLTGYKESLIIQFILLSFISFHKYPRAIIFISPVCMLLLLYILPTFTLIVRTQSWVLGKSSQEARLNAYQTFFDEQNEDQIMLNNWDFLTNRLTEIDMFTKYVSQSQQYQYDINILTSSLYALIPRFFWTEKPTTEKVAMERVYRYGVANRASNVSAKTRPLVDGYLMGGTVGIFLYMLCYGMAVQKLCNLSEKLFGGYQFGCVILFNSIFQPLWRGNNLEFILNNVFYGIILLLIIHQIFSATGLIVKKEHYENYTH